MLVNCKEFYKSYRNNDIEFSFAPNRFGRLEDVITYIKPFWKLGCNVEFGRFGCNFTKKELQDIEKNRFYSSDTLIIYSDKSCFGIDREVLKLIIKLHPDEFKERICKDRFGANGEPLVKYYLWWD